MATSLLFNVFKQERNFGLAIEKEFGIGFLSIRLWHLAHRIRTAMNNDPVATKLKGIVEVDETYVGGKPRKGSGVKNKRGRGTKKTPVMVMVERKGKAISRPVERVNAKTLKTAIKEIINKESTIMTDEWKAYTGIGIDFKGGHKVVNHGIGEYVKGDANTNTAESYFALLKRGVHGVFHHVPKNTSLNTVTNFLSVGITEK